MLAAPSLFAQSNMLTLTAIETGTAPVGAPDVWTFVGQAGQVVSFVARGDDGFDPVIALIDGSDRELIRADDARYPDSTDALLEAITLPRTDSYRIEVSGFNGSAGDYTLQVLPGYSLWNGDSQDASAPAWESFAPASDALTITNDDEAIDVRFETEGGTAALFDEAQAAADFYASARVQTIDNDDGWRVGITARRDGERYYLFEVSDQGLWRFSLADDDSLDTIRDWTPHPNIVPGVPTFTLGMLAHGGGFDFFVNSGYVGSSSDERLTSAGAIGLAVGARSSQETTTQAVISEWIVTTPTLFDDARVTPETLIVSDGVVMARALQRRHVVGAGVMSLTVPESSVEFAGAGINRVMLGRGATYTNFAFGATLDWRAVRQGTTGCGLIARAAGEDDYTLAFVDSSGGYGIARYEAGAFASDTFGEDERAEGGRHHLLVIADGNTVYFYLDGRLVGTADNQARAGEVGTAVVNYDAISTTCAFSNLWLWSW